MPQQSAFVSKLQSSREKLCGNNCCFDICGVSLKLACMVMVVVGGEEEEDPAELNSGNLSFCRADADTTVLVSSKTLIEDSDTLFYCMSFYHTDAMSKIKHV